MKTTTTTRREKLTVLAFFFCSNPLSSQIGFFSPAQDNKKRNLRKKVRKDDILKKITWFSSILTEFAAGKRQFHQR